MMSIRGFVDKLRNDVSYRKHIITYLLVGILTTIVSLGSFWLIRKALPFINENIANIASIALAILTAYASNRKYVFKSTEKNIFKEFVSFCSGRLVTMLVETVSFYVFATFLGLDEMLVKIAISVVIVILNYIISKVFVFKNRKEI